MNIFLHYWEATSLKHCSTTAVERVLEYRVLRRRGYPRHLEKIGILFQKLETGIISLSHFETDYSFKSSKPKIQSTRSLEHKAEYLAVKSLPESPLRDPSPEVVWLRGS